MEWINFEDELPPEGVEVLVTDGIHYDVAWYLMSGEYIWRKNILEKDDVIEFTAFTPIKWKEIE